MDKKLKRLRLCLEIIGLAAGLTLIQMILSYILLKLSFFEAYKAFFNKFLFVFGYLYLLFVFIMSKIFGDSFLNLPGFMRVLEMTFFIIFIINLVYFALSRYPRSEK